MLAVIVIGGVAAAIAAYAVFILIDADRARRR
jgi:hypothetical protein